MVRFKGQPLMCVFALAIATATLAGCTSGPAESPDEPTVSTPSAPSAPTSATTETTGQPAPVGTALAPMSQPPVKSLWALSPSSYDEGVEIRVEFSPYGIGPSAFGPSIVVLVTSAQAQTGRVPDLTGRNVVFLVGDTSVKSGGRYRGAVVTRAKDDRIVFVLTGATLQAK